MTYESYKGVRIRVYKSEGNEGTIKFSFGQARKSTRKITTNKFQLLDPNNHKVAINKNTGERSSEWSKIQYWDYDGDLAAGKAAVDKLQTKGLL